MPRLLQTAVIPNVAILNLSPPDKHGYCSLGTEVCCAYPASRIAKTIIAQINPRMPRTHGTSFIHYNDLDYVVNVDDPLPSPAPREISEAEEKIGKVVASLIPDHACLQMGIGGVPDSVLRHLKKHKDLGIHTEMFADGAVDLIKSGVVTNIHKAYMPGKTLTSFVMGSQKLYDFVDDNPMVSFMDASATNNPHYIGSNPLVVAINSAVQVDLTGQVNADSVGQSFISGVGGQVDFERGASISRGGIPIIALASRNKNGTPKIVPILEPGSGVITSRYHVHYVATEFGYADLFGMNVHLRAKALIEIAHPDDRESLESAAFERYRIKTWL